MGQHYTSLTVECSAWCNKCGKMTQHRVADKRLQYCLPCYDRPKPEAKAEKTFELQPEPVQGRLF